MYYMLLLNTCRLLLFNVNIYNEMLCFVVSLGDGERAKVINRWLENMSCVELKTFSTLVAFCFPLCRGLNLSL